MACRATSKFEVAGRALGDDSYWVKDYGQFCPIARSSELLAERWTLVIVRNLLNGCRTFSEIRQGAPGIPPALLTQRLHLLERNGVLIRTANPNGRGGTYRLTEMGQALGPVCDALGQWGARWLEIQPHHLDPAYILWATVKLVDIDALPAGTTTVRVRLTDDPTKGFWMLLRRPQPELCTRGIQLVEDLLCETDAGTLVDLHLRRATYHEAIRTGRLRLQGAPQLERRFVKWFRTSPFADYVPERLAPPSTP
jgi:DNA-binding HxlR family transcriptional regulator